MAVEINLGHLPRGLKLDVNFFALVNFPAAKKFCDTKCARPIDFVRRDARQRTISNVSVSL